MDYQCKICKALYGFTSATSPNDIKNWVLFEDNYISKGDIISNTETWERYIVTECLIYHGGRLHDPRFSPIKIDSSPMQSAVVCDRPLPLGNYKVGNHVKIEEVNSFIDWIRLINHNKRDYFYEIAMKGIQIQPSFKLVNQDGQEI
jgi:hypothetical protein